MLRDISTFASLGVDGIAIGALDRDGSLDVEEMRKLVGEAAKHKLQGANSDVGDQLRKMIHLLSVSPSSIRHGQGPRVSIESPNERIPSHYACTHEVIFLPFFPKNNSL